jgi:hypothetical protein
MQHLFRFEDMVSEKVDFFEKGKFWSINGKKVRVVGSIPQNTQVLKVLEVDDTGKPVGKPFVVKKGNIKGYKPGKQAAPVNTAVEDTLATEPGEENTQTQAEPEEAGVVQQTQVDPKIVARYKELLTQWKQQQKVAGKNFVAGEGTRKRLMNLAKSEVEFDESTDVDKDIASLKKRPSYDVLDRLGNLVKSGKVKNPGNVLKYVDFLKVKMTSGDSNKMSMN